MPMLVVYNGSHHRMIPASHGIKAHEDLVLAPGLNRVPDAEWKEAKKLEVIQALIEDGTIEEPETKAGKPAKDLSQLAPKEALKLVGETIDVELLKSFRETAKGDLAKAIDAQLKALEDTEPKK